jgi:dienelactone hydrolase
VSAQSSFLAVHLASHGLVVASPEHVGNTVFDIPPVTDAPRRRAAHNDAVRRRPLDLIAVYHALTGTAPAVGVPRCRADAVGVAGHSFGGWTALKLAARPEVPVVAVLALAPASEPFVGRRAFAAGELPLPPSVATLLLASDEDALVSLETSVRPLAARLGPHHRLLVLRGTDHYHYCDHARDIHELRTQENVANAAAAGPADAERPGAVATGVSRPFDELVPEARAHRAIRAAALVLFARTLAGTGARAAPEAVLALPWAALDPCITDSSSHVPARL